MKDVRVGLSTLFIVSAISAAAAFAIGRSTGGPPPTIGHDHDPEPPAAAAPPPVATTNDLPVGHPPVDPNATPPPQAPATTSLTWKVPARWTEVPNPSSMRIATYRPTRAAGDTADAEVSVTQAGGSVTANADRWVSQFDAEGQKTAKRTTKTIAGLEVTFVEVEGTFAGMGGGKGDSGFALVGAIVATPGMPHFFKITGPKKTVKEARPDLDALLATMTTKS